MHIVNPFESFRHPKLDANEGVVFARQLQQVSAVVNRYVYPALRARLLVPSQPDGRDPIATTYNYQDLMINGAPRAGAARNNTAPNVDVAMSENVSKIRDLTASYEYDQLTIQRALRAGVPLSAEKGIAARYIIEREINSILLLGDSSLDIPGLLGNASIDSQAVANGAGGTPQWSTKTPDEIEDDISELLRFLFDATEGTYDRYVIALPFEQYGHIATKRLNSNTETTILSYLLARLPLIEDIVVVPELATSGNGATTTEMVALARTPEVLHSVIPQEYMEEAPQVEAWTTKIFCSARCGGTVVRKPMAIARRYDI